MTPAIDALVRAGIAHRLHPYEAGGDPRGYGLEAAARLGLDPARVFKTLLAELADGRLVVAVVPVAGTLDLKALARAAGTRKATMADPARAERSTGYIVGGISPIAQKRRLPTWVDTGATTFPSVYVSGGRRGLDVELAPDDLVRVTGAKLADIAGP